MVTQRDDLTKYCIDCEYQLIPDDNWPKYLYSISSYLCKSCKSKRNSRWQTANPKKRMQINGQFNTNNPDYQKNWRNTNPEDWKIIKNKYEQSDKGKQAKKKYNQSNKGKVVKRKSNAKRRKLVYISMFENPFADIVKVDWHHIDNQYVVAIPRELHKLYCGYKTPYHRELCMNVIKQIYLNGE